jgi:uncharacterized protein YdcH (DUF465 family)
MLEPREALLGDLHRLLATKRQRLSVCWPELLLAPLEPVYQEVRMPETEALIERLTQENHEFRTLHDEHKKYDDELATLSGLGFLSPDQRWRVSELKKLKLIAKDRMELIIRHARTTMHA